jgi:hypothetical protein
MTKLRNPLTNTFPRQTVYRVPYHLPGLLIRKIFSDWALLPVYNAVLMVVARASNRVLVSLPFCRNMEYLQKCIMYTMDFVDSQNAIRKYPSFLKPYVLLSALLFLY